MKQITISVSEYERLKDLVQQADARHGLEMAALERRYQERITQMQRDHQAEVTRLESVISHQEVNSRPLKIYNDPYTGRIFTTCEKCSGKISQKDMYCKHCGAKMDREACS